MHGRLHRGAARGGHRVRRDGASTTNRMIIDFVEKPADPPRDAGPARHGAGQHGHLHLQRATTCTTSSSATSPTRTRATTSARTSFRTPCATARRSAHPFELSCVSARATATSRTGATSARSTPTGTPTSTSPPPMPQLEPVRHALADLDLPAAAAAGQVRAQPGRPPRHGDRVAGLGRLHRLGRGAPLGAVLQRARAFAFARSNWSVLLPGVQVGRRRAADARGRRPRLRHPGRHGDRRGRRATTRGASTAASTASRW